MDGRGDAAHDDWRFRFPSEEVLTHRRVERAGLKVAQDGQGRSDALFWTRRRLLCKEPRNLGGIGGQDVRATGGSRRRSLDDLMIAGRREVGGWSWRWQLRNFCYGVHLWMNGLCRVTEEKQVGWQDHIYIHHYGNHASHQIGIGFRWGKKFSIYQDLSCVSVHQLM